jgi:hypothetical protein
MLAERILSRGRTSIIEHHRAVSWAEREYTALYKLMGANNTRLVEIFTIDQAKAVVMIDGLPCKFTERKYENVQATIKQKQKKPRILA